MTGIYNHPYHGFFFVWQIVGPRKRPDAIRNWHFRPVNCTIRHHIMRMLPDECFALDVPF